MARTGKIARLPKELRDELNRRLRDGWLGPRLLPWLNAAPGVAELLAAEFGGRPITAANLSEWRLGGYEDWLRTEGAVAQTKLLAEKATELASAAGGRLAEGSAAILAGKILMVLEEMGDRQDAEALASLTKSVALLRAGDMERAKAEFEARREARRDAEFDLKVRQFQMEAAGRGLEMLDDQRAREIAASEDSHAEKIEALGRLMFGEGWRGEDTGGGPA